MFVKKVATGFYGLLILSGYVYANDKIVLPTINGGGLDIAKQFISYKNIDKLKQIAFENDVAILAKETGYDIDLIRNEMQFQEDFNAYAKEIMSLYPDRVSAFFMEGFPNSRGYVKFISNIPSNLPKKISSSLGKKVIFLENGKYTLQKQKKLVSELTDVVLKSGLKQFMIAYNIKSGKFDVETSISDKKVKKKIIGNITKEINNYHLLNKTKVFHADEINFIDKKINMVFDRARGGSKIWNSYNTSSKCTSGWTVLAEGVGTGILTAGHCMHYGKNRIQDHKQGYVHTLVEEDNALYHSLSHDVAYYSTPNTPEDYMFHASSNEMRYLWDIQSTSSMAGQRVCMYGRASNIRTCNHTVLRTGVSKVIDIGYFQRLYNLVEVTNNSAQSGDSGGGWSWGSTAFGVQQGHDNNTNYAYFTPIEEALEALNGIELYY
ncbi:MAG: S1 family peptidase [Epsilonproteobacteria bacterium]|nr:S1 family peptidase [Campylobacterota bacterium]